MAKHTHVVQQYKMGGWLSDKDNNSGETLLQCMIRCTAAQQQKTGRCLAGQVPAVSWCKQRLCGDHVPR
jgi:hypothetical protein